MPIRAFRPRTVRVRQLVHMPHSLTFLSRDHIDQIVVVRADQLGYRLIECQKESGELWWEWRRGDTPHPQFVTRPQALTWMRGRLSDGHAA